jgi:hypothetical protein
MDKPRKGILKVSILWTKFSLLSLTGEDASGNALAI